MIPEAFVKRFFIFVILPRTLWRMFVGGVFLTLVSGIEDTTTKQFIAVLGTGIMLGAVFGIYRAIKVLFADSEQVKQSVN
jgi:hypothetical protein